MLSLDRRVIRLLVIVLVVSFKFEGAEIYFDLRIFFGTMQETSNFVS
jgi:phage shock protein PspC (stress-responsive transcriptional regulator)